MDLAEVAWLLGLLQLVLHLTEVRHVLDLLMGLPEDRNSAAT